MSKVARKADVQSPAVPLVADNAIETVDGKDPGVYRRYDQNGIAVSRELTVEIGAGMSVLSMPLLGRVARLMKLPSINSASTKVSIIEAFQDLVIRSGVKILVSRMTRATMKRISLNFGLPNTKQRNIVDHIIRIGLPTFLHEKCDVPLFLDLCAILGLEAGKYVDNGNSSDSDPDAPSQAPYIVYTGPSDNAQSQNGADAASSMSASTDLSNLEISHFQPPPNSSFFAKSSAELERELADEIMLMGMEDILQSLTIPTLHEIASEMALLPLSAATQMGIPSSPAHMHMHLSHEPHFYIGIIMDHIFDLIPLDEYLKHLPIPVAPAPAPIPSKETPSSSNTNISAPPSSPFVQTADKLKKRKGDDPTLLPVEAIASPSTSNDVTSTLHTSSATNASSANSNKKAKISENSVSAPVATPSAESLPDTSTSMEVDAKQSSKAEPAVTPEPKRARGRPPKASTVAAAAVSPPSALTSSPPSVNAASSPTTAPTSSVAAAENNNSKNGPSRRSATVQEPSPAKIGSKDASLSGNEGDNSKADEEEAESLSKILDQQSPSLSSGRAPRKAKTAAQQSHSPSTSTPTSNLKSPKSVANSKQQGSKSGERSQDEEEEEEYEESDESSSEDEVRTTPTGGKGRAKYQAPPLTHIKKGITGQDLHNLYNVTDLQDWCRQHKVDHTGKKSAVIKRILYTLDPLNAKPPPPKKARRFASR